MADAEDIDALVKVRGRVEAAVKVRMCAGCLVASFGAKRVTVSQSVGAGMHICVHVLLSLLVHAPHPALTPHMQGATTHRAEEKLVYPIDFKVRACGGLAG